MGSRALVKGGKVHTIYFIATGDSIFHTPFCCSNQKGRDIHNEREKRFKRAEIHKTKRQFFKPVHVERE